MEHFSYDAYRNYIPDEVPAYMPPQYSSDSFVEYADPATIGRKFGGGASNFDITLADMDVPTPWAFGGWLYEPGISLPETEIITYGGATLMRRASANAWRVTDGTDNNDLTITTGWHFFSFRASSSNVAIALDSGVYGDSVLHFTTSQSTMRIRAPSGLYLSQVVWCNTSLSTTERTMLRKGIRDLSGAHTEITTWPFDGTDLPKPISYAGTFFAR